MGELKYIFLSMSPFPAKKYIHKTLIDLFPFSEYFMHAEFDLISYRCRKMKPDQRMCWKWSRFNEGKDALPHNNILHEKADVEKWSRIKECVENEADWMNLRRYQIDPHLTFTSVKSQFNRDQERKGNEGKVKDF